MLKKWRIKLYIYDGFFTEKLSKYSIMVVVSFDHIIKDEETYLEVLKAAINSSQCLSQNML
ncbi:hypothetical protein Q2T46_15675 [Thermoanaerobacterium sp. CMT5567-10]|uniref:hypothetical protein n=1 Tax=Thermoanaerobacterium sp. CMT5567-10 TaxID=3061989 RepID=UPI00287FD4F7|nr:hypothetical protein [Thermoanaerobacterium sp. CMT5567-10]WLY85460.1 hypothetical protein Q2T46_15675 [Thermoanaerobacterium sp. CMT5567-10]